MDIKMILVVIIILAIFIAPISLLTLITNDPPKGEISTVMATVIDSEYQAGYYSKRWTGKFYTNVWHEPKYLIIVEYNDITLEIDDEGLYNLYQNDELELLPCIYHIVSKSNGMNECYLTYGG